MVIAMAMATAIVGASAAVMPDFADMSIDTRACCADLADHAPSSHTAQALREAAPRILSYFTERAALAG